MFPMLNCFVYPRNRCPRCGRELGDYYGGPCYCQSWPHFGHLDPWNWPAETVHNRVY